MNRLVQVTDHFRRLLIRWVAPGVWVSIAALATVTLWGIADPFRLRQRLDWLVTDQFLLHRPAPAVHADLLLISKDDRAAYLLGTSDQRHRLARALQMLPRLGARSVLIDFLWIDPGSPSSFHKEESIHDGIPPQHNLDPAVAERYRDDQMLAQSMAAIERGVIPYSLDPTPSVRQSDQSTVDAMARQLEDRPDLDAAALAERLGIPSDITRRLYDPSLELAAEHIAAQPERAEQLLQAGGRNWPLLPRLSGALDRLATLDDLRSRDSFPAPSDPPYWRARTLDLPLAAVAQHARLGFANIRTDHDARVRRVALLAVWTDRYLVHQTLAVLAHHLGTATHQLSLEPGHRIRVNGEMSLPLDRNGNLAINWPMNRRRDWATAIPQISLADLLELARYEADINLTRYLWRRTVAEIDQKAATGSGWSQRFFGILEEEYRMGMLEEARRDEQELDRRIPEVLDHPDVRAATAEADRIADGPAHSEIPEDSLVGLAVRLKDIQKAMAEMESEREASVAGLQELIRGKLCLVGDTTTGSVDIKPTPVGSVPGVAIVAAALNTALTGGYLTVWGVGPSLLILFLFAAILTTPLLRFQAPAAGALAAASLVTVFLGSYALLVAGNILVSPVLPVVGLFTAYVSTASFRWWTEFQQRKLVRTIFEAQTNPAIVERLIEAGQAGVQEVLAPRARQVTVLFAEIADYDELAGQTAPERLPEVLSRTFGTMAKIILAHEGTLDRYQGHAMVAFFGAPVYQPDHAQRACRAAIECCETIRALAPAWRDRSLQAPRVQIGLHTGELLVGNITLTSRVDYTVAGENLNVAYRIGELNETYGTEIMVSESTVRRCENAIEARELDVVRIKGRREPVRAFELMSAKGRLSPEQLHLRGTFSTGLLAFRKKDFAAALAMFRSCRETSPGDRPATIYIERCERELSATSAGTSTQPP